jgi:hypothetical protein
VLLAPVLWVLSGGRSSRDLEAVANYYREEPNQGLDLNFKRWPFDATFL